METTYFQTFIEAFAAVEQRSRLLDDDYVLCPPSSDFGYHCTPLNAVTFAQMGVDGVHYALLKIEGQVHDNSPVIRVSPMDFDDDIIVLAESFLSFLAVGCDVSEAKMQQVFDVERTGTPQLVDFLSKHFQRKNIRDDERIHLLTSKLGSLIERKP